MCNFNSHMFDNQIDSILRERTVLADVRLFALAARMMELLSAIYLVLLIKEIKYIENKNISLAILVNNNYHYYVHMSYIGEALFTN